MLGTGLGRCLYLEFLMKETESYKSVTIRFAAVILLVIFLLIPLLLVRVVLGDRWDFYREAAQNISNSWADSQFIEGPMIVIPVLQKTNKSDKYEQVTRRIAVMPATLDITVNSQHHLRSRGFFEVPVFELDLKVTGTFNPLDLAGDLADQYDQIQLEHATLEMNLSDTRGIRDVFMLWDDKTLKVSASSLITHKISLVSKLDKDSILKGGSFSFTARLRTTQRVDVAQIGDETQVRMTGTWPHPSFDGRLLPVSRSVTEQGYEARWTANALSRSFASVIKLSEDESVIFDREAVGLSFYNPVLPYRSTIRSIKYGGLFILLTLLAFLCLEMMASIQFHYVQYGVVGTSLTFFFLVLLSLAEHIGFNAGYFAAAALLISMLTGYLHTVAHQPKVTWAVFIFLTALYTALFTILQLDEYSLLIGTTLLLAMLGLVMWATKNLTIDKSQLQ